MSKQAQKKQEQPAQQQAPKEPIILPQIKPAQNFMPQTKNSGTATFSNIAKQAESLVSGDNSIVFNNYNNNAVFRSSRVDLNDCVSVDAVNKSIKNVNELTFSDKSSIKGICDGYVLNNQGLKVLINDKNIALSTAFSYRFAEQLEKLSTNLKKESANRLQSHNELHAMIKEMENTEVHDKDMKINGTLELMNNLKIDHFGIRNDGDLWTAFTMNDIDWMAFDNDTNKIYMYKPVEMNKAVKINDTFNVGKLKIVPTDSDNYSMFSLNDEHFMSFNANDDSTVLYKNVNTRGNLVAAGQINANAFETKNYIKFTNDTVANDYAYIQLKGTAANAGELEIATCDDATEPIYIRQYSGNRATLKRTLTLLDANGNTSIPQNLNVSGSLTIGSDLTLQNAENLNLLRPGINGSQKMLFVIGKERSTWNAMTLRYDEVNGVHQGHIGMWGEDYMLQFTQAGVKIKRSAMTVIHTTNVHGEIGTFCETTGELSDMWVREDNTDCICQVKTSTSLNARILGIICKEDTFASHGDVLVKVVQDTYELGDILVPTENGYGRKATEEEELFMMRKAIPRPKITSLNAPEGFVATFLV